jgi:fermentation-respiration switch protein FrsA (DUF1100 family)
VIAGHSQGGHAALFAAALAKKWVPELKLRGTVAFAPASHLETQFRATLSISAAGAGLGAIVGLGLRAVDTVQPALGVSGLLTPRAQTVYPQTATVCYAALSAASSFGGVPLNEILRTGVNLDPLFAAVGANDPEKLSIKTPLRIEQGDADGTVFPSFTNQLVDAYKAAGTPVTYKVYPGVTHGGVVDSGAKDSATFIKGRFK